MGRRIVVEWTKQTVRVAVSDGSGSRFRLRTIRATSNHTQLSPSETLRQLLKGLNAKHAQIVGVIAREQIIMRVVKFPTLQDDELSNMIEIYSKAQLPYPRDQVVIDYHILSRSEGFSTVGLVVAEQRMLEKNGSIMREAGLHPGSFTLSTSGVFEWHRNVLPLIMRKLGIMQKEDQSLFDQGSPLLIVNIDDARTDFVVVIGDRLLTNRSVGQGIENWSSHGQAVELLGTEIERTRAVFQKEMPEIQIQSVLLTGISDLQWQAPLSERLGLRVNGVDPTIVFKKQLAACSESISPVVISGLALSNLRGTINLMPPETKLRVQHHRKLEELVLIACLLVAVMFTAAGFLALRIFRQQNLSMQLSRAVSDIEPIASKLKKKASLESAVSLILDHRAQLSGSISQIIQQTPSVVLLERIYYNRAQQELSIRGQARTTQDVLDYAKQLEGIKGVVEVNLKYATQRLGPQGERTDFELLVKQTTG